MDEQKPAPEETGIAFSFNAVTEKPTRRYRKGSKYDPIIEAFIKQGENSVSVTVKGKDGNYLRTQLNKRIEAMSLQKKVKTSVINNVLYLDKI